MLTAADLTYMQDTQIEAMPGTVVIERVTLTPDGMGGNSEEWAAAGTVIGRIYPQRRRGTGEMVGGAQVLSETTWWGTLDLEMVNGQPTIVHAKDRLTNDGRSYEVISTNNGEMWRTAIRCELENENEERRT